MAIETLCKQPALSRPELAAYNERYAQVAEVCSITNGRARDCRGEVLLEPPVIGRRPMKHSKLRRQIAWEAARLMYDRSESEYYQAKMKAARRVYNGWVKPGDLPSNGEIRAEIDALARLHQGARRTEALCDMRLEALRMMRLLARFRPRLVGSVLTGHIRQGSDIDLHVFADSVEAVTGPLDAEGMIYDVERKQVNKPDGMKVFVHVHIRDRYPFELTVYGANKVREVTRSSVTGKAMERASIAEFELRLEREYPDLDLAAALAEVEERVDRFQVYQALLLPLEAVRESHHSHPEADVLYHSLQVFDQGQDALPYDEEFLLAALLHDVGKAIDRHDHVAAGLDALDGFISARTAWLIEHHMLAHVIDDRTIGLRALRRLQRNESYEELLLLGQCDRGGRQVGVPVPELDEALDSLRAMAETFGL
jgi:hypothetical protein